MATTDRETAAVVALLDECADCVSAALGLDSEDRAVVFNALSPVLTAARASSPPSPGLVEAARELLAALDDMRWTSDERLIRANIAKAALRAALLKEPAP